MPQFSSIAMTLKMLNAHKNLRQKRSLWYCNDHFGHYGLFATLPLHTAVITTDDFEFSAFLSALRALHSVGAEKVLKVGLQYAGELEKVI